MATQERRRRRVLIRSSGHAHTDIYPSDKKCALVLGIHRATANRYNRSGGPLHAFADYLDSAPDTFRIMAHLQSRNIQKRIAGLTKAQLVARYHEVIQEEPRVESEDHVLDKTPGACWLNRARASERDSAINAEKAAIEREFAVREMTEAEVWGWK